MSYCQYLYELLLVNYQTSELTVQLRQVPSYLALFYALIYQLYFSSRMRAISLMTRTFACSGVPFNLMNTLQSDDQVDCIFFCFFNILGGARRGLAASLAGWWSGECPTLKFLSSLKVLQIQYTEECWGHRSLLTGVFFLSQAFWYLAD